MGEILAMDYGENLVSLTVDAQHVPFNNFTYRVSTNAEEIHLPSKWNAGWHNLPPQFTATFTVYATKGAPKVITEAQLQRKDVSISLLKRTGTQNTGGQNIQIGAELDIDVITLASGRIIDTSGQGFNGRDMATIQVTCRFNSFAMETP